MAYVDKEKFKRKLQYIFKTYRMSETITEKVKKALDDTTVDVVEVCRCKDCVYWDGRGYDGRCEAPKNGLIREYTNYDDFCSYGERKEK